MVVSAAEETRGFVPPQPPPRWWLRISLSLVVVAALVAGGLWAYHYTFVRCGDGVSRQDAYNECIGVTDGSVVFNDKLEGITGKIKAENDAVEKSGRPWVSVVYVEPYTLGSHDKGYQSVMEELQGAYLAQLAHNKAPDGTPAKPQIKLLLGNPGRGLGQWKTLTDQILSMDRVVAVAGFGQSRLTTLHAVNELRGKIPMVGSTVTADKFSHSQESGFYRAAATNHDEASAVVTYLRKKQARTPGFHVQLVKDVNNDDLYTASLRDDFVKAAKRQGLKLDGVQRFRSGGEVSIQNYRSMADAVCDDKTAIGHDAVYFAGRGRDLRRFIGAVGQFGRSCPLTVYTGDDAVGMPYGISSAKKTTFHGAWYNSGIKVSYTALAAPELGTEIYGKKDDTTPYRAFEQAYRGKFHDLTHLNNGQAMLGYDAMLMLGQAVQDAAFKSGDEGVTAERVNNTLTAIQPGHEVDGASGTITLDDQGNPVCKPLPLVSLTVVKDKQGQKQKKRVYDDADSPLYPVTGTTHHCPAG